jgi:hypothetical protein
MRDPNVLQVDYNGANNTGAEALLLADDAGQLRPFHRWLVRRIVSKTDLIVAHSAIGHAPHRYWP